MSRTLRWLAGLSVVVSGSAMSSEPRSCPDMNVRVSGASAQDFGDICTGMAAALSFFATHGVHATETISVEVTHPLPKEAGATAAGCYLETRRRIYVVPYAAFRKNGTWFDVPIDRAMYRSLASHEAGHAIAACNFRMPNPTIQAKEYLAYVAMFSTMPHDLRDKVLAKQQGQAFSSLDRFTPVLYLFDPMRFGAEAYRHFLSAPDPTSVVREVLAGQALTD